ncbi:hypothetical protein BDM02DRAFT_3120809 [Thelephora ganbajun]|uniref:Uncharacterized protein n=1 Tax=Thelephora ganbajun TaxID=370292 RepID=A0ACB6Z5S9_THEGA|nr:hypothetical protein BDM02DRAFT_3120809 [Thelephora ganbajun]
MGILVLTNINSFPFTWHYKIFRHVWSIKIRLLFYKLTLLGKSRETRKRLESAWLDRLIPIGSDPWGCGTVVKKFAGPDESDYNLHLSNSSYPKVIDEARMITAIVTFPNFYRVGGWTALGGTHFSFYREIPMFSNYEIRTNVASWDDKWLYIIHRFVSHPKKRKGRAGIEDKESRPRNPASNSVPVPILHTPALGTNTPSSSQSLLSPAIMEIIAAARLRSEEPDGAMLNCVAVSETCFKIGRITVPPSIALVMNGISQPPTGTPYSHENPPPYWNKVKELTSDPRAIRAFLSGGWREVPPAERWWEHALTGSIEQTRKTNLELLDGLRRSMEGAKALY